MFGLQFHLPVVSGFLRMPENPRTSYRCDENPRASYRPDEKPRVSYRCDKNPRASYRPDENPVASYRPDIMRTPRLVTGLMNPWLVTGVTRTPRLVTGLHSMTTGIKTTSTDTVCM